MVTCELGPQRPLAIRYNAKKVEQAQGHCSTSSLKGYSKPGKLPTWQQRGLGQAVAHGNFAYAPAAVASVLGPLGLQLGHGGRAAR